MATCACHWNSIHPSEWLTGHIDTMVCSGQLGALGPAGCRDDIIPIHVEVICFVKRKKKIAATVWLSFFSTKNLELVPY